MAFVSQIGLKHSTGKKKCAPFVVFRKSSSGSSCGNLNRAMPFRGERIDIQIDHETKRIRIGAMATGCLVEPKGGQFSCSFAIFNEVGADRIWLELSEDGWWYGSYGEAAKQGEGQ